MQNQTNYLKKIRHRKGYSLTELSKKTSISVSAISNFEHGRRGFSKDKLDKISNALGISTDEIFSIYQGGLLKEDEELLENSMRMAKETCKSMSEKDLLKVTTHIFRLLQIYKDVEKNKVEKQFLESLNTNIYKGIASQAFIEKVINK